MIEPHQASHAGTLRLCRFLVDTIHSEETRTQSQNILGYWLFRALQ